MMTRLENFRHELGRNGQIGGGKLMPEAIGGPDGCNGLSPWQS